MAIIALDLGSKCGVAYEIRGKVHHELWDLRFDGKFTPASFDLFRGKLLTIVWRVRLGDYDNNVNIVVEKTNSRMPSWFGLRIHFGMFGMVECISSELNTLPVDMVPALTLKKWIAGTARTGKGLAGKEPIIFVIQQLYPEVTDDNECDALALLHYAEIELYGDKNE